ncbi:hypothetical protein DFS33DRAFT_1386271 [Desarmillaria ectypa]|nr:hypothetical protein DFS33DRAFT_1386271 [Desarmillaria ectypa]
MPKVLRFGYFREVSTYSDPVLDLKLRLPLKSNTTVTTDILPFFTRTFNNCAMYTIRGKSLRTYSSPMAPLLFSNALPPDSDRPVIRSLIVNAEEALLDFDQQVATVRAKFAQYLDFHRSLLSPILRLPEDVLLKIFEHGCAESRRTVLDLKSMPWLLTHICSHWRSLVRSSPTLWRFFRVVAKDCYSYRESRQLEIANEFLRLSGQCPLHISIESADIPFLNILISQGMRWHTAVMPLMPDILHYVQEANFPLLRRVTIMDEPVEDPDDSISEVGIFQHAPLLTAATINTENGNLFKFHALTHLTVWCLGDNWTDVIRQLNAVASTLTHCTLSFRVLVNRHAVLRLRPLPDATLPHLLSLTVREPQSFDPSDKDYFKFLDHLTLPSLTSLALHTFLHYHNVAEAVVSLIRRSRCSLTSLKLNSWEVAPVLHLTSRLTHLTLKLLTIANGDLNCLVCGNCSPLVPKLEVLTLDVGVPFEYATTAESDSKYVNLIVDIIKSRCPHDAQMLKGGVDCLRVLRFISPDHRNHSVIQKVTARLQKEQEKGLIIEYVKREVNVDEAYWSSGPSEDSSWYSDSDSDW